MKKKKLDKSTLSNIWSQSGENWTKMDWGMNSRIRAPLFLKNSEMVSDLIKLIAQSEDLFFLQFYKFQQLCRWSSDDSKEWVLLMWRVKISLDKRFETVNKIHQKGLLWYSYLNRIPEEKWSKQLFQWVSFERNRRGRPRNSWKKEI